jgi:hypothetical protein
MIIVLLLGPVVGLAGAQRWRALVSSILTGVGVALAAAGVVLYVTAPRRAESAGIVLIPMVGPSELPLAVQGGF